MKRRLAVSAALAGGLLLSAQGTALADEHEDGHDSSAYGSEWDADPYGPEWDPEAQEPGSEWDPEAQEPGPEWDAEGQHEEPEPEGEGEQQPAPDHSPTGLVVHVLGGYGWLGL